MLEKIINPLEPVGRTAIGTTDFETFVLFCGGIEERLIKKGYYMRIDSKIYESVKQSMHRIRFYSNDFKNGKLPTGCLVYVPKNIWENLSKEDIDWLDQSDQ